MKRMLKAAVALAAVGVLATGEAEAQAKFMIGGGLAMPTGEFSSTEDGGYFAGNGFNALAGVTVGAPMMPFGVRVDGSFNRFGLAEEAGEMDANYQVLAGTANAVFSLPVPGLVQPYLLAGVGVYNSKLTGDDVTEEFSNAETNFGINGGVGVNLSLGGLSLFGEARMHNVFISERTVGDVTIEAEDIRMIPVTVGLRLGH
jgi:opacity protein-like surface antigen